MAIRLLLFCLCVHGVFGQASNRGRSLPEYVVSECYGDIFSFDCGPGNKIRINRDFFGVSSQRGSCSYTPGDCITSNPKSNSLIHRYCTGRSECTYYQVERRGCQGYYSNYQQVEYQCVPNESVTDICSDVHYQAADTYVSSPNFPKNYPPNQRCACVVTPLTSRARVRLEIVYMAIKYTDPCRDWLRIGRRKMCGTSIDLFSGRRVPVEFISDRDEGHSGFWLHFHSSAANGMLDIRCGRRRMAASRNSSAVATTESTPSTVTTATSQVPTSSAEFEVRQSDARPSLTTGEERARSELRSNNGQDPDLSSEHIQDTPEKRRHHSGGTSPVLSLQPSLNLTVSRPAFTRQRIINDPGESRSSSANIVQERFPITVRTTPIFLPNFVSLPTVSEATRYRKQDTEDPVSLVGDENNDHVTDMTSDVTSSSSDGLHYVVQNNVPEEESKRPNSEDRNNFGALVDGTGMTNKAQDVNTVTSGDFRNGSPTVSSPDEQTLGDGQRAVKGSPGDISNELITFNSNGRNIRQEEDEQDSPTPSGSDTYHGHRAEGRTFDTGLPDLRPRFTSQAPAPIVDQLRPTILPSSEADTTYNQVEAKPRNTVLDRPSTTPVTVVSSGNSISSDGNILRNENEPSVSDGSQNTNLDVSRDSPNSFMDYVDQYGSEVYDGRFKDVINTGEIMDELELAGDAKIVDHEENYSPGLNEEYSLVNVETDKKTNEPVNQIENQEVTRSTVNSADKTKQSDNDPTPELIPGVWDTSNVFTKSGNDILEKDGVKNIPDVDSEVIFNNNRSTDRSNRASLDISTAHPEQVVPPGGLKTNENQENQNDKTTMLESSGKTSECKGQGNNLNCPVTTVSAILPYTSTNSKKEELLRIPENTSNNKKDGQNISHQAGDGVSLAHDERVKVMGNSEVNSTMANVTLNSNHEFDNTTLLVPRTTFNQPSFVTMGLIILAICIGLGLLFVFGILIAVYYKRKRQRSEQTQIPEIIPRPNGSGTSGTVSSRDAVTSSLGFRVGNGYRKGAGHQTRLTYDSPFMSCTNSYKTDKFCQVDLDVRRGGDHLMSLAAAHSPAPDSDICTPPVDIRSNHKGVQVGKASRESAGKKPPEYAKPKRGRTIRQKDPGVQPPNHSAHIQGGNLYEFYSNVTVCPLDITPSSFYSRAGPSTSPGAGTFFLDPEPMTSTNSRGPVRHGGGSPDREALKQRSMASMSEMSEVVINPEGTFTPGIQVNNVSDDSDWETKSAISI